MSDDKYEDYKIESAAECLMKAEEIRKDKKMMEHVSKYLKKKKSAISSVQGLRDKYNEIAKDEE